MILRSLLHYILLGINVRQRHHTNKRGTSFIFRLRALESKQRSRLSRNLRHIPDSPLANVSIFRSRGFNYQIMLPFTFFARWRISKGNTKSYLHYRAALPTDGRPTTGLSARGFNVYVSRSLISRQWIFPCNEDGRKTGHRRRRSSHGSTDVCTVQRKLRRLSDDEII